MVEIFPNLKETNKKMEGIQRAPNKLNPNRPTPRHITIKTVEVKDKERILKAAKKRKQKRIVYQEIPIRLLVDFSAENLQSRKECHEMVKVLKGKNL